MDVSNVKLGIVDRFRVYLKRREAQKTEDERLKYEPNDDYNPDYTEANALEQELLSKKVAKLKQKQEKKIAKQNRKQGIKMLSEGTYQYPENNLQKFELKQTPYYKPKVGTLDFALEQYLYGVLAQASKGEKYNSYHVLTNLNGISTQKAGDNEIHEKNLITALKKRSDIIVNRQGNGEMKPQFYHIRKNQAGDKNIRRLYLNCKRENIASLAENLIRNMDDMEQYYFKFVSDDQANKRIRIDKIIFYIKDDHQLNDVIQRIQKTKREQPKLLEGSENTNLFMPNIDGFIAYAKSSGDEEYEGYYGLKGNRMVKASYNNVLATALEDSFMNEISKFPTSNAQNQTQPNDRDVYIHSTLPEVLHDDYKKMQLIAGMKTSLKQISDKNPILEIIGIDRDNSGQIQGRTE